MADFQGPGPTWSKEILAKVAELEALMDQPKLGPFTTDELEQMVEGWDALQSVPSYCERYARRPEHMPFCMNLACECHNDLELLSQQAGYVDAGLLTSQEFLRTLSGLQI